MTVFSNPSRAQFQRFTDAGEVPSGGQPGSFAVNLVDRRLWTFDQVGSPLPLGQLIADHDPARAYAAGALVLQTGALWQADMDLAPKTFDAAEWSVVSAAEVEEPREPSASGVFTGGVLGLAGGVNVSVTAGTGVIVASGGGAKTEVSWATQTVSLPANGATVRAVVVQDNGGISSVDAASLAVTRRNRIILGYVGYDSAGTQLFLRNVPRVAKQAAQDLGDLVDALGGAFVVSGARVSAGTGLTVNVTGGRTYGQSARWRSAPDDPSFTTFAPATAPSLTSVRSDNTVVSTGADVPVAAYEGGALPAGFSVSHFLFSDPAGSEYSLLLGSTLHPRFEDALRRLESDWQQISTIYKSQPFAVLLGAVIVTGGVTADLDGRVIPVAVGPKVNGRFALPTGDLGFLQLDGSAAMQGNLDMNGFAMQNAVIDEGVF